MGSSLLTDARVGAGLSKAELARRTGTSRPTVSAYEHGRVSPSVATLERLLAATGTRLVLAPQVQWTQFAAGRGRVAYVPDRLPTLPPSQALRTIDLPLHLDWSSPTRRVRLTDRRLRLQAYEVALREGGPDDIESIVDGTLLVDGWDEIVLPRAIRSTWQPLVDSALEDG